MNNPQQSARLKHWHMLLAVLAATFAAYARTLSFEFVHDDFLQLVNNPAIHSWRYLSQYFTANVWESVYPGVPGNYYRPVFLLWCRLNDAVFGNQPGWWHLTTVLTHVLATGLIYFLVWRLVEDRLTAGIAALIFGLHPVHIEAVAWVSGVTEPLLAVFLLGSFLGYLKSREQAGRTKIWRSISLVLFAVAMLEKETAVILPILIGIYEWLYDASPDGRFARHALAVRARRALGSALPYLLLVIPYLAARFFALNGFHHFFVSLPLSEVVYTWPSLIFFWMKHLAVPAGLATFYDFKTVAHPTLVQFFLPAVAVLVVAGALVWGSLRSRIIGFASAWMVLPLLPLLDLRIFPHNDFAHDRYLYLPSVGFSILVALAFRRLRIGRARLFGYPAVQIMGPIALAFILALGTASGSFYFKNNWIFYRYGYLFAPRNVYAANNYGVMLGRLGMEREGLKVLQKAVAEDPGYWSAAYNLGCTYYQLDQPLEAERYLLRAVRINPTKPEAYYCLGLAEMKMGKISEAKAAFQIAVRLNPEGKESHYRLGLVLEDQGNLRGALEEFRTELAVNPRHPDARRRARRLQSELGSPAAGSAPQKSPP